MNGTYREQPKGEDFYTYVVPHNKMMGSLNRGEYVYSFATYPLLLQPSGSANYSELNDSVICINFTDHIIELLKVNQNLEIKCELWGCAYKIIRVASGFGALAFNK